MRAERSWAHARHALGTHDAKEKEAEPRSGDIVISLPVRLTTMV
jgi:hypothetical protein